MVQVDTPIDSRTTSALVEPVAPVDRVVTAASANIIVFSERKNRVITLATVDHVAVVGSNQHVIPCIAVHGDMEPETRTSDWCRQ